MPRIIFLLSLCLSFNGQALDSQQEFYDTPSAHKEYRAALEKTLGYTVFFGCSYYLASSISLGKALTNGLFELAPAICLQESVGPNTLLGVDTFEPTPICELAIELCSFIPLAIAVVAGLVGTAVLAAPAYKIYCGDGQVTDEKLDEIP